MLFFQYSTNFKSAFDLEELKVQIFFKIHFIFMVFFSLPALSEATCQLPTGVKIEIYSESHGSKAAVRVWDQLIREAAYGTADVYFEAIPRSANSQPEVKSSYVKDFIESGYLLASRGETHLHGMDSNELKFISLSSVNYIINAFDGEARDPVYLELYSYSIHLPEVRQALMANEEFASTYGPFLYKRSPAEVEQLLLRSFIQRPKSYAALVLKSVEILMAHMQAQSLTLFNPNLESFAKTGDPRVNEQQFIVYNRADRDKYMATSIVQNLCGKDQNLPLKLSVGFEHAPGIKRELERALVDANISIVDVE